MHSALKCSSQMRIVFPSICLLRSGVISLVLVIKRIHSSRAFLFNAFECSPSLGETTGILNKAMPFFFPLLKQPKKAQFAPGIAANYIMKIYTEQRRELLKTAV